jgi:hypothetical protein
MTYSVEPFTYSRQFRAFGLMATRTIPVHTPRRGFPLCHMQDSSVAGIWREERPRSAMGSGVRERRTEPAPFTPRPNAGKRRCLVLLRVTGRGFRVLPDIALRFSMPPIVTRSVKERVQWRLINPRHRRRFGWRWSSWRTRSLAGIAASSLFWTGSQ